MIGGELGGRSLVAPRGWKVRPTSDRVREAISLERAAMEMAQRKIRHLVIVDGGELVGVLSMRDIMRVWTTDGATSAMTPG